MRYRIRAGFANITLRLRQNIAGKDAVKIVETSKPDGGKQSGKTSDDAGISPLAGSRQ
jgi:hypothetical protein